jgi:tetratricopeptide (TPR) repeat protein
MRLMELSPSDVIDMLVSLLKSREIPIELKRLVMDKSEGNPFYVEELINSLIESDVLIQEAKVWVLKGPLDESIISPNVHGIIRGRIDRLENNSKRTLQEASVIGRSFLYEILKKITSINAHLDRRLTLLEQLDFLRTKSLKPDLEYIFKHALVQEVVYDGLLKKDRRKIHKRIAETYEKMFFDRLQEFYETISYHYEKGECTNKAVDYLMMSGAKSLKRYALKESYAYYKRAYGLLMEISEKSAEENQQLMGLLISWCDVLHLLGAYNEMIDILKKNEKIVNSMHDKKVFGVYYSWLGIALQCREQLNEAYTTLTTALQIGEANEDQHVIGYACAGLAYTCADIGLLQESIAYSQRAISFWKGSISNQEFFHLSYGGAAYAYYILGDVEKTKSMGLKLLNFGHRNFNHRCQILGHIFIGSAFLGAGDFPAAINSFLDGMKISSDPLLSNSARFWLGMSYVFNGQAEMAEETLAEVLSYTKEHGIEYVGTATQALIGIVKILNGELAKGINIIKEISNCWEKTNSKYRYASAELILGQVYCKLYNKEGPKSFKFFRQNIGFFIMNLFYFPKYAEQHLNVAIKIAEQIGAQGILGQSYLNLGLLYKAKKNDDQATKCISLAIKLFENCGANIYLKQAREALGMPN